MRTPEATAPQVRCAELNHAPASHIIKQLLFFSRYFQRGCVYDSIDLFAIRYETAKLGALATADREYVHCVTDLA